MKITPEHFFEIWVEAGNPPMTPVEAVIASNLCNIIASVDGKGERLTAESLAIRLSKLAAENSKNHVTLKDHIT